MNKIFYSIVGLLILVFVYRIKDINRYWIGQHEETPKISMPDLDGLVKFYRLSKVNTYSMKYQTSHTEIPMSTTQN